MPQVKQEHQPDITISVEKEERVIQAHRAILMAASPYFEKMLTGEAFVENNLNKIILGESMDFDALDKIIRFMYTDELSPSKTTSLTDLIRTADYLQVDEAINELNDQIEGSLDSLNVLQFWSLRNMIKHVEIISTIRTFILTNFEAIVYDISFLELDFETVSWILESDELVVPSEETVYRAIRMWINHDSAKRNVHFVPLLRCFRYNAKVKSNFIADVVGRDCNCTESMDFLIAYLAKMNGYEGKLSEIVVKPRTPIISLVLKGLHFAPFSCA